MPLYWRGEGALGTTADALTPAFREAVRALPRPHLEVETYTFGVLPAALRDRPVEESLAHELRWTLDEIRAAGVKVEQLTMAGGAARGPGRPAGAGPHGVRRGSPGR